MPKKGKSKIALAAARIIKALTQLVKAIADLIDVIGEADVTFQRVPLASRFRGARYLILYLNISGYIPVKTTKPSRWRSRPARLPGRSGSNALVPGL